jgi:hypothetical protein
MMTVSTENEERPDWYVPKEKWQGQETREYPQGEIARYVASYPHGSPDPVPGENDKWDETDHSRITFQTEKRAYSLGVENTVAFKIAYAESKINNEKDYIVWHRYSQNIEQWQGETWVRLIDVNNIRIPTSTEYAENISIYSGESETGFFSLDGVITRLLPGKYRLVAYVNYEPVYAEFELTE